LQAHGLDREMLQKREVVKIDIANDPVDRRVGVFLVLIINKTNTSVHSVFISGHLCGVVDTEVYFYDGNNEKYVRM